MNFRSTLLALLSLVLFSLNSCTKDYAHYGHMEVVEDTFNGFMEVEEEYEEIDGDFIGVRDSGIHSFAWHNHSSRASLDFDITAAKGSVQIIFNDASGKEVLNQTIKAISLEDSFSGVSRSGKSGMWLMTIRFEEFTGEGSFSLHPGD